MERMVRMAFRSSESLYPTLQQGQLQLQYLWLASSNLCLKITGNEEPINSSKKEF